jgi:hypothetical protein
MASFKPTLKDYAIVANVPSSITILFCSSYDYILFFQHLHEF